MSKSIFNFENEEFISNLNFYKEYLDIDLISYCRTTADGEEVFAQKELFEDTVSKVYTQYQTANKSLPNIDFHKLAEESFDDLVQNVYTFVIQREQLHKIINAHGDDLKEWMDKYLNNVSKNVVSLDDKSDVNKIAGIFSIQGCFLAFTGCCARQGNYARLVTLAPEGAEGVAGISAYESLVSALSQPEVLAVVIVAVLAIGTIITITSLIERELSCLIINDTDYDIVIDDIHIESGELKAMVNDSTTNVRTIPRRESPNMVNLSFYTIARKVGFYGAESTMHFTVGDSSVYVLTANPLSQDTRVGVDFCENTSSEKMHDKLYDKDAINDKCIHNNLCVEARVNSQHGEKAYAFAYFSQIYFEHCDFSEKIPDLSYGIGLSGSDKTSYCFENKCLEIEPDGFICLSTCLTWEKGNVFIELMNENSAENGVLQYYEGENTCDNYEVCNAGQFTEYHMDMSGKLNAQCLYTDLIEFKNLGTCKVYVKKIEVHPNDRVDGLSDWMKGLPGDLLLSEINIPGTHDSAAIHVGELHTLYACHDMSITEQLNEGIRLLDVRIKIKNGEHGIEFVTCHGHIDFGIGANEYQSLSSLMDECANFLREHAGETIIMLLQIDQDEVNEPGKTMPKLLELMQQYPIRDGSGNNLGTLAEARGKIVLFNRIKGYADESLGYRISWTGNTRGSYADISKFKVYVQDHYDMELEPNIDEEKGKLVIETLKQKRQGEVMLNYASACKLKILGVYCIKYLISFFGENKPKVFGWMFFDYENMVYDTDVYGLINIVSIIVDSNYQYSGCDQQFHLKYIDEGYPDFYF